MTTVLDIIIPLFAGLSILAAVAFALRASRFRSRSSKASYGVAQQEARQAMQIDFVRALAALLVGLILAGIVGLSPIPEDEEEILATMVPTEEPADPPTPTQIPAEVAPEATATNPPAVTVEPTSTAPVPTNTPQPAPTETATPEPASATVSSEAGVWLRSSPGTESEQLEWVLDGEVIVLLPGLETADELEWQQVRTAEGNEGWVAVLYIEYNE